VRLLSIRFLGAALGLLVLLPAGASARTIVSLEFDDATTDQVQVGPMLAAHGMRGTFFVNSGLLGTDGVMSVEEVLALQAQGNEIAGHTTSHLNLRGVRGDVQGQQICGDRKRLTGRGFTISSFAYPGGAYSKYTKEIVTECGYDNARTVFGLACPQCPPSETLPPRDPLAVRTAPLVNAETQLETLKRWVIAAEDAPRRGWLPLVFHHVCDGCSGAAILPANLNAFLDWLALRPGTLVMTVRDVLSRRYPLGTRRRR
jgi:peptidoglycan/xylan/chitin deacetylase (PgdA/CDA1 family)